MLIQFRVENHRSLRDEQALTLTTTGGNQADRHLLRVDGLGENLVPVAAIYGANASGKSNVLSALRFMRSAVLDSQRRWDVDGVPRDPFLLADTDQPSLYEVDIVVDGVRYRYGFRLGDARVIEEWLFAWPRERKASLFERDGDRFEFGKLLRGENEAIRSLTRPNSLFLFAAAQNNHATLLPIFRSFSAWRMALTHGLYLGSISSSLAKRLIPQSDALDRGAILQLLRGADTGILDVRVDLPDNEQRSTRVRSVFFRHRAGQHPNGWLPLALESAGTVRLLELAPHIVDTLRDGGLLCVDELEASLHPTLALQVVRMFNDPAQNTKQAQLVFATHDANLLGSILGEPALHRDQVWFTEKDDDGATKLYPLTDFHPRKEENLERGYLQGRYGAVPFLGDFSALAVAKPKLDAAAARADRRGGNPTTGVYVLTELIRTR